MCCFDIFDMILLSISTVQVSSRNYKPLPQANSPLPQCQQSPLVSVTVFERTEIL